MKQQNKTIEDGKRRYIDTGIVREQHLKQPPPNGTSSWFYLGKAGEIGYTISVPIVGGALIGAYLDHRWSTYPKATLAGIFGGLFLSVINFIRLIIEIIHTP